MLSTLRSLFGIEKSKRSSVLERYSRDISAFKITPNVVYYPRTVSDVVSLVTKTNSRAQQEPGASVTVRAGGTCMSGGPLNTDVIIDLTRHMHEVRIDTEAKTADVQMGAYFRDIEDAAAQHGLMFAPYPSSRRICGIGGMIGNNASGEKSVRFGATGDNILSMQVVLADGSIQTLAPTQIDEVYNQRERSVMALALRHKEDLQKAIGNVPKAASGYRLDKVVTDDTFNLVPLFCGAQGTLGIVISAVLKLVPIPEHVSLVVISAHDLSDIPVIVKEIFKWNPEAVETFDINTFKKAQQHLSEHAASLLKYVVDNAQLYILAEFSESTKEATNTMASSCVKKLEKKGYHVAHVVNQRDAASIWEIRRNSFLLMRDYNEDGYKAIPCIEDVIVPVSALPEFVAGLTFILKKHTILYGFHGHIGDGSLRIVPIFKIDSPTLMDDIDSLMRETFILIKKLEGNMSADHSDGIIRSPYLRDFYGESLFDVFQTVKQLFDPYNIMNPGKKVGASKEAIGRYFDRTRVKGAGSKKE